MRPDSYLPSCTKVSVPVWIEGHFSCCKLHLGEHPCICLLVHMLVCSWISSSSQSSLLCIFGKMSHSLHHYAASLFQGIASLFQGMANKNKNTHRVSQEIWILDLALPLTCSVIFYLFLLCFMEMLNGMTFRFWQAHILIRLVGVIPSIFTYFILAVLGIGPSHCTYYARPLPLSYTPSPHPFLFCVQLLVIMTWIL